MESLKDKFNEWIRNSGADVLPETVYDELWKRLGIFGMRAGFYISAQLGDDLGCE